MNKILRILKVFAIIVACLFFVMTFMASDCTIGERIAYVLVGSFILAFLYIPTFRNLLFVIFFFLLFVASLPLVFDNGSFVWPMVLMEVAFICAFVYFFRKVFGDIRLRKKKCLNMYEIDNMTGLEFEHFTADLLSLLGYNRISVTKASGDQGIDVIAYKDGLSYAIQCKHYSGNLGNSAVQEAYAGKTHYGCFYAVVFTNSYFTEGAKELASSTGVLLWDRSVLQEMLLLAGKAPLSRTIVATHTSFSAGAPAEATLETPSSNTTVAPSQLISDDMSIHCNNPSTKRKSDDYIDNNFIAEAQWYAAHCESSLTDDE